MHPDRNDYHIGVPDYCSVETDQSLQIDTRYVDEIGDSYKDDEVDELVDVGVSTGLDVEHLEETDPEWKISYMETMRKRGKTLII